MSNAATRAGTALNRIIDAATTLTVELGEVRQTSKAAQEPTRPYFRLIYQSLGETTEIPGRRAGLVSVYCFAKTPEDAWFHACSLTDALGLTSDQNRANSAFPDVSDYWLDSGWLRATDPTGGGLVLANIGFHYYA